MFRIAEVFRVVAAVVLMSFFFFEGTALEEVAEIVTM